MSKSATFALLLTTAILIGCGPSKMPMGTVSGTVTVDDGTPVEGGRIIFTPTEGGPGATGKIDAQGGYTLSTYEKGDGAVVGTHQVSFASPVVTGVTPPAGDLDVGPEVETPPPAPFPPAKYRSPHTSGLTASVKQGSNPPIDFTLVREDE